MDACRRTHLRTHTLTNQQHKKAPCKGKDDWNQTHKVTAAFVQEPVSEPNGFQTHKVAAAFVQEPVSEPNGFGMVRGCMYGRTHLHTHTLTNQQHKKAPCKRKDDWNQTHKVTAAFVQEPVSEPNGFETHKVAAAFVQEPVSEPNGFGMERGCMYGRTHLHTHTLTNQHHKKAPCKGKTIENQTHKVAAVFVQEPVSEPNGFQTIK